MGWEELNQRGIELAEKECWSEAIALFSEVIASHPEEAGPWLNRALASRDMGLLDEARADLAVVFRDFKGQPVETEAHRLAGQIAFERDEFRKAVHHHRRSCRLDPSNPCNFADLGEALIFCGRFPAALRAYYTALSHREPPHDSACLWQRAVVHVAQGQWRAAVRDCQSLLEVAGWQDELAPYAAVYLALAEPSRVSELHGLCPADWPGPVLSYLAGRLDAAAMLARAEGPVQRVESTVYLALALRRAGEIAASQELLRPIQHLPLEGIYENVVARAWIEPRRLPPPTSPERLRAWLWGSDQSQMDELLPTLLAQLDPERLQLLALALQLGAAPVSLRAVVDFLEGHLECEPTVYAAITALSFDPTARVEARRLLPRLGDSPPQVWLARLLRAPWREPLVVVDVEQRRAYRMLVSGAADNFQLHILLAAQWGHAQPGVAAIFRGYGYQSHPFETAQGVWNLYSWRAPREGKLPLMGDDWVWNEGSFDDIPSYDGEKVLLLGPPAAVRTFNASRLFAHLPASLEEVEELDATAWFDRLGLL